MNNHNPKPEARYGMPAADHILYNRDFTVGYSYLYRQPRWTLEIIDPNSEPNEIEDRLDNFRVDPRIPDHFRPDLKDYKNSGYDRGHMVASANRRSSDIKNSETFLLSNMCPQNANLNRRMWAELEKQIRSYRNKKGILEIYIMSGPLFKIGEKIKIIGLDDGTLDDVIVPVPDAFFKCILVENIRGALKMFSFAFPNNRATKPFDKYLRSVRHIEKWSGLNIWGNLRGSKYENMKKRKPTKVWF